LFQPVKEKGMKERLVTDSSKVRILVIDDDFQVSETIQDFLAAKGFDVGTAHNEKQGIHVLDLRINSVRHGIGKPVLSESD
jgi:ActR/RegA family two-component response regulator